MALNAPYTANTVIQSSQVSNDLVGLANGSNDTATNSMSTFRSEAFLDFVASGCVWTGDSLGATRAASMTAGVVYISGVRLTVAVVTARLFTASKDTYIDSNNSGTLVYTEVANNAASPALAASSIRIGIIITGATSIAAATSINQGQETMILPIASSIPYSVCDSLGNMICCRDPDRMTLGYRQLLTSFVAGSGAATDVTGLNLTVLVPANRKIEVIFGGNLNQSGGTSVPRTGTANINEGATVLQQAAAYMMDNSNPAYVTAVFLASPSSGSHTYKIQVSVSAGGNGGVYAAANAPAYVKVKLA